MIDEIDGISTRYRLTGKGNKVLLLHGWMAGMDSMAGIENYLVGLGYCTLSFDFPGMGESAEPPSVWSVSDYAKFTLKLIEHFGFEGCDLVCHSFGGRVALYLASDYPSLFSRLVMIGAAGVRPKRTIGYYMRTGVYKLKKKLVKFKLMDAQRLEANGSADYKATSGIMRGSFVKVVNENLSNRLSKIDNDTLLIWGSEDKSSPLWMGKLMEKHMKNAGLAVINGAGHFCFADDPAAFTAIIGALFNI